MTAIVLVLIGATVTLTGVAAGQTTVTLSGTITDESGGALAGVTVTVGQNGSTTASTTSQSDGTYSLTLDAGTYDVAFSGGPGLTDVSLADQDLSADTTLDVVLVPVTPEPVVVSGVVRDSSGAPVPGAVIQLTGGQQTPVAADGSYTQTVFPGTLTAAIDFPCRNYYSPANACSPERTDYVRDFNITARNIQVTGPTTNLDFTLPDRTITLITIDEDGNPVPDPTVTLTGDLDSNDTNGDYDGTYAARILPTTTPGTTTIHAFVTPDNLARLTIQKDGYEPVTQFLTITNNQQLTITLTERPQPVVVSGVVRDSSGAPVPGAVIQLTGGQQTPVAADGSYTQTVFPGTLTAAIDFPCRNYYSPANACSPERTDYVRDFNITARNIQVTGPTTNLDFTLPDRTITLITIDEDGNPVPDPTVTLTGDLDSNDTNGDYDGTYAARILPTTTPGTTTIHAFVTPDNLARLTIQKDGYEPVTQFLTITNNQQLTITLTERPQPVVVSGVVRDSSGAPVPGAVIQLTGGQQTPVAADGSYTQTVFPGTLTAAIDFPCRNYYSPANACSPERTDYVRDFNITARNIQVTGPTTNLDFTLPDRTITLITIDEDGNPVPDPTVTLTGDLDSNDTNGDYDGTYAARILPTTTPGTTTIHAFVTPDNLARLTIQKDGYEPVTQFLTITNNQQLVVVFVGLPEFEFPIQSGETVTSDDEDDGPTVDEPLEITVTSPLAGTVELTRGPVEPFDVVGFELLDSQVEIVAPEASAAEPLTFVFELDGSVLPPEGVDGVTVFRNTVAVPPCTATDGSATPDPCVSDRSTEAGGAASITVLTSRASIWAFGIEPAPANEPPSVEAGPDQTTTVLAPLSLAGLVDDDGQVEPVSTLWAAISGPGTVVFDDPTQVTTTASFNAAGVYELELTAFDGEYTVADQLTVTVDPLPGGPYSPNVTVAIRGGSLIVTGDNASNFVQICAVGVGAHVVTIYGGEGPSTRAVVGVTRDIRVTSRNGDDRIAIGVGCDDPLVVDRDLIVNLGSGDDELIVAATEVGDDISINGGAGADSIEIDDVVSEDRASVNTAAGASRVSIAGSRFARTTIRGGSSVDDIAIRSTDLGDRPSIFTLNGDDTVTAMGTVGRGRVTISTGNGADDVLWSDGTGASSGTRGAAYFFNGIFGGQDDEVDISDALVQADRLNGGGGTADRLGFDANGGARINGFELLGPVAG